MLEIKTNDTEPACKIIVVGVGGAGNNASLALAVQATTLLTEWWM